MYAEVVLAKNLNGPGSEGPQALTRPRFSPVKPRAPGNLTVNATDSHMWQLTWSDPYPPNGSLHSKLSYLVNISNEDDPTEVSGHVGVLHHLLGLGERRPRPRVGDREEPG